MSPVSSHCPACGAPIVFGIDTSVVTVCKHCSSVVARGDGKLEDHGKISQLSETGAQLELGRGSRFAGRHFILTGRTQLQHEAGGVWDEWYAAFDDGKWGWLAEAQGKYYLSFEKALKLRLPPMDALVLGQAVPGIAGARALVVQEKGVARPISAEGELPYALDPNGAYAYADLSGRGAGFATIDYASDPPIFYFGKEVTLAELGIKPARRTAPKRSVSAKQLACPNCGGPVALRAPDAAKRVVCPNCDCLLDASTDDLRLLETLRQKKSKLSLPLGKDGVLFGDTYTVVGFVERSVTALGERYPWEEYLLHNRELGFRWLVFADGHWSFGKAIEVASVALGPYGRSARYDNVSYRLFQDGEARVESVYGEFYWEVRLGEKVSSSDFIAPPFMLSCEEMKYLSGGSEIAWTQLVYLESKVIADAFAVKPFAATSKIAPNQVFPHKWVYKDWRRAFAAALVLFVIMGIATKETVVFDRNLGFDAVTSNDGTQVFFSEPFSLGRGNIEITLESAELQDSWIFVQGDFVEEDSGLVQVWDLALESYAGIDDGEAWSEGAESNSTYLSALPAGRYTLRLETQWGKWQRPISYHLRVRQDVTRFSHFLWLLFLLSIIPAWTALRHYRFELRRWQESDYSPYSSSDDG